MEPSYDLAIEVYGLFLLVVTGAAYAGFRFKVAKLIDEAGDVLADMYAFLGSIKAGKGCDMAKAAEIYREVEVVWRDLEELAPFVAKILAEKSALAKK